MNDGTLFGFFNELEKIGGLGAEILGRAGTALAGTAAKNPGLAYWRYKQQKEGLTKHQQTMQALKAGYPAGWVALGMRPR